MSGIQDPRILANFNFWIKLANQYGTLADLGEGSSTTDYRGSLKMVQISKLKGLFNVFLTRTAVYRVFSICLSVGLRPADPA